jgi:hypothetical protein
VPFAGSGRRQRKDGRTPVGPATLQTQRAGPW